MMSDRKRKAEEEEEEEEEEQEEGEEEEQEEGDSEGDQEEVEFEFTCDGYDCIQHDISPTNGTLTHNIIDVQRDCIPKTLDFTVRNVVILTCVRTASLMRSLRALTSTLLLKSKKVK